MNAEEREQLMRDIERSIQMRSMLRDALARNQDIDLVDAWNEIEQLDMEIARKIRKRHLT